MREFSKQTKWDESWWKLWLVSREVITNWRWKHSARRWNWFFAQLLFTNFDRNIFCNPTESQISNADGIFLVRESSTAVNNYVLSVYFDTQFWHYQIQQHGEDAFFSIDGQLPIHGLEDLIEYYRNNHTNLCTKLKNFVKKHPPPVESRRHGKHNLLHRATKHNHLDVVKEMLKTSYRNLDAKDEFGMTAVHLACKNRVNPEIMKLLIERGATLTSRDSSGNTPLHVRKLIASSCVNEIN